MSPVTNNLTDLDFEDDIALLGSTQEDFQELTAALQREAMKNDDQEDEGTPSWLRMFLLINQQHAEEVDNFT